MNETIIRSAQRSNRNQGFLRLGLCRASVWFAVFGSLLLPALPAFPQGRAGREWAFRQHRRILAGRARARNREQRAGFFRRLRDLQPKEQERVLANDKRFQRLPPERQQRIRENLHRWNDLSPQRREQLREREAIFSRLSPAQRQEARGIFLEWRDLRPDQRQRIMRAFRHMRDLPPGARQQFLASPEVQQRFSPQEQNILERLGRLLPPGG